MSKSNTHINLFTNSGCLTADALNGYMSGVHSDLQKDQVDGHLEVCEFCSDALEGLQLIADPQKVNSVVSEINENLKKTLPDPDNIRSTKIKKQTRLYYYAAAASIVILMGFYFYLQNNFINESGIESITQVVDLEERNLPPMPKAKFEKIDPQPDGVSNQSFKEVEPTQKKGSKKQARKERKIQVAEVNQSIVTEKEELDITYVPPLKAVRAPNDIPKSLGSQERATDVAETIEPEEYIAVDIASVQPIEYYIGGVIVYDKGNEKLSIVASSAKHDAMSGKSSRHKSMDLVPQKIASESNKSMEDELMDEAFLEEQNDFENESQLTDENHFFSLGNEVPQYPGGYEALMEFLNNNLSYPKDARELGLQGQVIISFMIEENGKISSSTIIKGIGGGCDVEALRVIELMPDWQPAYKDGKPMKVLFNMPITFKLN